MYQGIISRYREHLPLPDEAPAITLCEGNTPLIPLPRLADQAGLDAEVFVKLEGLNPTGSFKDRGMTVAVTNAAHEGAVALLCASTGNTSASAAAYAARAGLRAVVIIPDGKLAIGKLSQALIHDAVVIAIQGNFDDALKIVRQLGKDDAYAVVNSTNPFRLEGQKTAAFELVDDLGGAPDYLCLPVGNAGNITAYWKGFREYHKSGRTRSLPKLLGFQAAGSAPIVRGTPVQRPETLATAIRIGNPANWETALKARDESAGLIDAVTDEEIISAYRLLAVTEGIFCEPSSAASIAGLIKSYRGGMITKASRIVCVLTGNGLKNPDQAFAASPGVIKAEATVEGVVNALAAAGPTSGGSKR